VSFSEQLWPDVSCGCRPTANGRRNAQPSPPCSLSRSESDLGAACNRKLASRHIDFFICVHRNRTQYAQKVPHCSLRLEIFHFPAFSLPKRSLLRKIADDLMLGTTSSCALHWLVYHPLVNVCVPVLSQARSGAMEITPLNWNDRVRQKLPGVKVKECPSPPALVSRLQPLERNSNPFRLHHHARCA
jgi:hypothetical protein